MRIGARQDLAKALYADERGGTVGWVVTVGALFGAVLVVVPLLEGSASQAARGVLSALSSPNPTRQGELNSPEGTDHASTGTHLPGYVPVGLHSNGGHLSTNRSGDPVWVHGGEQYPVEMTESGTITGNYFDPVAGRSVPLPGWDGSQSHTSSAILVADQSAKPANQAKGARLSEVERNILDRAGELPPESDAAAVETWLTQGLTVPSFNGEPIGTEEEWRVAARGLAELFRSGGSVPYEVAMARAYRVLRTVALLDLFNAGLLINDPIHGLGIATTNGVVGSKWGKVAVHNGHFSLTKHRGREGREAGDYRYDQRWIPLDPEDIDESILALAWTPDEMIKQPVPGYDLTEPKIYEEPVVVLGFPLNMDRVAQAYVDRPNIEASEALVGSQGPVAKLAWPMPDSSDAGDTEARNAGMQVHIWPEPPAPSSNGMYGAPEFTLDGKVAGFVQGGPREELQQVEIEAISQLLTLESESENVIEQLRALAGPDRPLVVYPEATAAFSRLMSRGRNSAGGGPGLEPRAARPLASLDLPYFNPADAESHQGLTVREAQRIARRTKDAARNSAQLVELISRYSRSVIYGIPADAFRRGYGVLDQRP